MIGMTMHKLLFVYFYVVLVIGLFSEHITIRTMIFAAAFLIIEKITIETRRMNHDEDN